jgi:hypothetical protein
MIETLHKVLTDASTRSSDAVKANLVETSESALPWFD